MVSRREAERETYIVSAAVPKGGWYVSLRKHRRGRWPRSIKKLVPEPIFAHDITELRVALDKFVDTRKKIAKARAKRS